MWDAVIKGARVRKKIRVKVYEGGREGVRVCMCVCVRKRERREEKRERERRRKEKDRRY